MTLSGNLMLFDTGSTLDMAGHALSANVIYVGYQYGWELRGMPTLANRGRLTANLLDVANQAFDLYATDSVINLYLSNGSSTINTPISSLDLPLIRRRHGIVPYRVSVSVATRRRRPRRRATSRERGRCPRQHADAGGRHDAQRQSGLYGHDGSTLDMAGHSLQANQLSPLARSGARRRCSTGDG